MLPKSNVPIFVYECFSEIVWYDFEPIRRLKELKEKSNKTKRKRQRYKKKLRGLNWASPLEAATWSSSSFRFRNRSTNVYSAMAVNFLPFFPPFWALFPLNFNTKIPPHSITVPFREIKTHLIDLIARNHTVN